MAIRKILTFMALCLPVAAWADDRTDCQKLEDKEARAACVREAGAAKQAARRGQLMESNADFEKNRLARCGYVPAADREDCERRARGEGTVTGSVEGGGIYRELRTTVPAPESPSTGGTK
jgi:hypothetical protein